MRFVPELADSPLAMLKRASGPLLCVLILFYLGFHAVSGERGLVALFKETRKLDQLTAELTDIRGKREKVEHKIKMMSNDSLDLDMLDEQARNVLGLAGKDEVVVFAAPK
jgi:cell division protein FtsB